MNLSDIFKKKQVGLNQTYGLTTLGKTKAEEFALHGPKWEVLATLNENGPSSVSEIADETNMNATKVKGILRDLKASGYIQVVSHDS